MQHITPFFWFDSQAEEAADFYVSLFPDAKIGRSTRYDAASAAASGRPAGATMTVDFRLAGQDFVALNGGPVFAFTPAISLFVGCESVARAETLWASLAAGGSVLMPFDRYPFSERFGWLNDLFGVSWQIAVGSRSQAITPALMFVGEQTGKAEAAMQFYTSQFPNAGIASVQQNADGTVKFAAFRLLGQEFIATDGGRAHSFDFTPAISFMVGCETQPEVDRLWEALSADPSAEQCGWLRDRHGVSWQIVPTVLHQLLADADPARSASVARAVLAMKKLDIAALQLAHDRAS